MTIAPDLEPSSVDHHAVEGATGSGFHRSELSPETPESRQLVLRAVARAKEGDRDALRFLYVRYADNVYGYVCSILRDEHDAEDVTQQVFAKLMTKLASYQPREVPFSAWVLRVARNLAIDHLRAQRSVPCENVPLGNDVMHETAPESARSFRAALESLPDRQREVVVLRYIAGLSPPEIAERINVSESSVHGLHHRARLALRRELELLDAAPATRSRAAFRERRAADRRRTTLDIGPGHERRQSCDRRLAAA